MIVVITPGDVIGRKETTVEWCLLHGIPAPFTYRLEIDTERRMARAWLYVGRIEEASKTIVIEQDPDTKEARKRPTPIEVPIKDLPPGLERALRYNVASLTIKEDT